MDFAWVAGGGHIGDAADNDEDDGDDAGNGDGIVKNNNERISNVTTAVGFVDDVDEEGPDDFGKADDGKTDEGVEDGVLGLLELTGIAGRSDVLDAADDDEGSSNDAGDANEPAGGIRDELFWRDSAAAASDAIVEAFNAKSDLNGTSDDLGKTDDGETDEGMG